MNSKFDDVRWKINFHNNLSFNIIRITFYI